MTLSLKSGLRRNGFKIKDSRNETFDLGNQSSIPFGLEVESVFGLTEINGQCFQRFLINHINLQ